MKTKLGPDSRKGTVKSTTASLSELIWQKADSDEVQKFKYKF